MGYDPSHFTTAQMMTPPPTPPLGLSVETTVLEIPPTEKSFNVIITSEKQPGSTGVVHVGVIEVDDSDWKMPIVAKIGFSSAEKYTLLGEHDLYTHLHEKGVKGIPRDIGLFVDLDRYDLEEVEGPYALVLTYAGHSLHERIHTISRETKYVLLTVTYLVPGILRRSLLGCL